MSRDLYDPEYPDVEITLSNGQLRMGPNTHPADIVRWVSACFLRPDREMTDECGSTWTGRQIVDQYLSQADEQVGGTSHAQLHAAVMSRWGGQ